MLCKDWRHIGHIPSHMVCALEGFIFPPSTLPGLLNARETLSSAITPPTAALVISLATPYLSVRLRPVNLWVPGVLSLLRGSDGIHHSPNDALDWRDHDHAC
eukprot:scaffold26588_cov82-Cyclotella_meneghiniana.AAC.1